MSGRVPAHPARLPRIALLLCTAGLGCAGLTEVYERTDSLVARGDPVAAAEVVVGAERVFGSQGRLLHRLELGALLHQAESYEESNAVLEEAKRIAEDLYTRSLSREAGSILVNDTVRDYGGESFERAMIHVLSALNYTLLGDPEGALVEARQVDALLAKLETDADRGALYDADPFARYLSALLFEDAGRLNDAVVAYRQALAAYADAAERRAVPRPPTLLPRALAAAGRQSRASRERMAARYGRATPHELPSGHGEVVVVHLNGWVPRKQEAFFEVSFGQGWAWFSAGRPLSDRQAQRDRALAGVRAIAATEILRVAFPRYVDRPSRIDGLVAHAAGISVRAHPVEDLAAVARLSLEDRRRRILVRAAGRAAFKYALAVGTCEIARRELEPGLAVLPCVAAQAYRVASEMADTRSWRNLPAEIGLAFLPLPEGRHDLDLRLATRDGTVVESQRIEGVQVVAGRRTYLSLRSTR